MSNTLLSVHVCRDRRAHLFVCLSQMQRSNGWLLSILWDKCCRLNSVTTAAVPQDVSLLPTPPFTPSRYTTLALSASEVQAIQTFPQQRYKLQTLRFLAYALTRVSPPTKATRAQCPACSPMNTKAPFTGGTRPHPASLRCGNVPHSAQGAHE